MVNPKISVVMPVYNCEQYLRTSIESILNQTYENFEFIIIDDGSTDASSEIIAEYKDSRIRVYKQNNAGVAISLNRGISVANGEWIARQDADDISLPTRFERQLAYYEDHPKTYLIGTNAELIDKSGAFIRYLSFESENKDLQKSLINSNPFIHGSVLINKECFGKVGMYREAFTLCQSYDLWLRISEKFEIGIVDECLYKYRVWSAAISYKGVALNNTLKKIIVEYAKQRRQTGMDDLMRNNYLFYEKYGKDIVDSFYRSDEYRWLKNVNVTV